MTPIQQLPAFMRRINWRKTGLFVFSLFLFLFALEMMKTGARALAPFITGVLKVENPVNGLGLGWILAYFVLSGSPAAAASLTFLDAGAIDVPTAFAMLAGSRLGSSMVVLLLGFIYMLRGAERGTSLATGLLSFLVTISLYVLALPLGYLILASRWLANSQSLSTDTSVVDVIDLVVGRPVALMARFLPGWAVFVVGLALIVWSFNLIDQALPEMKLESSVFSGMPRRLYRPLTMFSLGFGVTLLTMSVSVSLGLLVPLSVRGYIRRENLVPYIMGCNISTFVDTLIAGLLLGNPATYQVVLTVMLSVTMVSVAILLLTFDPYERGLLRLALWINEKRRRLLVFFILLFVAPVVLLLIRG